MNGKNYLQIVFKNKIDKYLRRAGYTEMKFFLLSIDQWLPHPLTVWAFCLGSWMIILLNLVNLVKSCYYNNIIIIC